MLLDRPWSHLSCHSLIVNLIRYSEPSYYLLFPFFIITNRAYNLYDANFSFLYFSRHEDGSSRLGTSYTDFRINEEEMFSKIVDHATE